MRYIFPRQFGLHNVFTSKVDPRESAMPFKDYTLREKDIHNTMSRQLGEKSTDVHEVAKWKLRVPKRLRGDAVDLVEKLRKLNHRCSYAELLRHYCPVHDHLDTSASRSIQQTCFLDLACPTAHVSAFCRAVLSKTIPKAFWGDSHNEHIVMYWVDQFVALRRFESLTLHQVTQKIHVHFLFLTVLGSR